MLSGFSKKPEVKKVRRRVSFSIEYIGSIYFFQKNILLSPFFWNRLICVYILILTQKGFKQIFGVLQFNISPYRTHSNTSIILDKLDRSKNKLSNRRFQLNYDLHTLSLETRFLSGCFVAKSKIDPKNRVGEASRFYRCCSRCPGK